MKKDPGINNKVSFELFLWAEEVPAPCSCLRVWDAIFCNQWGHFESLMSTPFQTSTVSLFTVGGDPQCGARTWLCLVHCIWDLWNHLENTQLDPL